MRGTPDSPVLDCPSSVWYRRFFMTFFAFMAALALAIIVHEIASAIQVKVAGRLNNPFSTPVLTHSDLPDQPHRNTLEAVLLAVFPKRFDEHQAANVTDVVGLLRRSG